MNLQSITGIYPSNIGSYTQSITGVYNTSGGEEYTNTDENVVIDSNIMNLSTKINVSNISADALTVGVTKLGILTGNLAQMANFAHKNFFTNTGYAFLQILVMLSVKLTEVKRKLILISIISKH